MRLPWDGRTFFELGGSYRKQLWPRSRRCSASHLRILWCIHPGDVSQGSCVSLFSKTAGSEAIAWPSLSCQRRASFVYLQVWNTLSMHRACVELFVQNTWAMHYMEHISNVFGMLIIDAVWCVRNTWERHYIEHINNVFGMLIIDVVWCVWNAWERYYVVHISNVFEMCYN